MIIFHGFLHIMTQHLENMNLTSKTFIHDDFMLTNDFARELYHESAENMPIIDYHCHLVPKMIADNHQFRDLTEIWLGEDHYKWRALRGNGVSEEYITGSRSSYEKFDRSLHDEESALPLDSPRAGQRIRHT